MYGKIKEHLEHELAEIKAAGALQERTHHRIPAACRDHGRRTSGAEFLCEQLPRPFGQSASDRSGEEGDGCTRLRHVVRAFHLRLPGYAQAGSRRRSPTISVPKTRFSMPLASTPTAACSNLCLPSRMRSSPIRSTMRRSSTACVCARPFATVTPTLTWPSLEDCLKKAQAQRFRIIVTDGVFSMDGNAAPLDEICKRLAEKYDALVMVDECHSAGVLGKTGRGITELYNLRGQVDILTGTLGKSLRRRGRRFHHRPQGDYRHAAPAFAPVPLLKLAAPCRSGCFDRDVQDARRERCAARQSS